MTSSDSKLPDEFSEEVEVSSSSGHLRVAMEIAIAALILVGIYFLFAPEEQIELEPPLQESQIDPIIRAQIDAAKQAEPQREEPQAVATTPEMESPAADSDHKVATETASIAPLKPLDRENKTARSLISSIRSGKTEITVEEILERAEQYTQEDRLADAYLLLFYAAREGDGRAAFALASMHDPSHFVQGNTLLEKPDSYQAHKWYQAAAEQKIAGAQKRLEALRGVIEKQAESGDPSAQRLLLNWR